jgi:pimeloyl-ACP methyl ester carboxylesterase
MSIERYGSGQPLLLIHGSPGAPQSWRGVGKKLQDRYAITAPTLPGHGSGEPIDKLETADIAARLGDAIGSFSQPVTIGAHSFGANVALHLALAGKFKIARMVLLEPVALQLLPLAGDRAAFDAASPIFDRYLARHAAGDSDAASTMIDFWFGAGAFAHMPPPVLDFMRQQTAVNVRDVQATFRERYAADALKRLAMPITVAYGDKSPGVALAIANALTGAVPDGRVIAIPGANHGMLASHADAVAKLIAGD